MTIERDAAGKALVADVKAKNLDASSIDLLRIVKARCTVVCAGLPLGRPECSTLGSTRVPPEYSRS